MRTRSLPLTDFDIRRCIESGQAFRWDVRKDGSILGVDGDHWYLVRDSGDAFQVESNTNRFRELFDLDADVAAFEGHILANSPELALCLTGFRGLRVMRFDSAREVLYTFLCSQNNHIGRITGMVRQLASYGPAIHEIDGEVIHGFPSLDRLGQVSEVELRNLRFGYRAASITGATRELLERGDAWLDDLRSTTYEEAHAELVKIRGIGPKLADCICLFGLHFSQAVPVDTHIWQQICRRYRPDWNGKSLTPQRYKEAGALMRDKFGAYAGWAQQFLFYENMLNWRDRNRNLEPSEPDPT